MKKHFLSAHFPKAIARYIMLLALALTLVSALATLSAPTAHAAPATHAGPAAPQTVILRFWTSFSPTTVGTQISFELDWENGGTCCMGFTAYYGDGSSDNYTCVANCSTGVTDFFHFYNARGTYSAVGDSSLGGPSPSTTVVVN